MVQGVQQDDGSFQRPTFDDIETQREATAKEQFGDDVDLSQGSPVKQLLDTGTLEHERIWQVLEQLYYSAYYEDAHGVQLDKILSLANIHRRPRQGATGAVVFQVNEPPDTPVTIPRGTRVATPRGNGRPPIPFKTMQVGTLTTGSVKTDRIAIKALEPWETDVSTDWLGDQTNVAANTITYMPNPISGIDSVYNPYPTGATNVSVGYDYLNGHDAETDHELRRRWENSLGSEGKASLDAIRSNVLQVPNVEDAAIEENVTTSDNTGTGGLPPKSFRVTVLGGAESEIAQRITDTRAAGIQAYGGTTADSTTDDGVTRTEGFDRAESVTIYVNADLHVDANFPSDGPKLVENAIIEYIGGETVDGDEYPGTDMGADVVYDQVLKRAMSVDGVVSFIGDLTIGTSEPPTETDDLTIGDKEAAATSGGAIVVTDDRDEQ